MNIPAVKHMLIIPLCCVSQAQFSHIGASLHTRTPFSYRVPVDSQPVFLLVNVLYMLVPQALCYRCCTQPAFFLRTAPEKKNEWQTVGGTERVPQMPKMPKLKARRTRKFLLCLQLLAVAILERKLPPVNFMGLCGGARNGQKWKLCHLLFLICRFLLKISVCKAAAST